jgi:hypothetical protein
VVDGASLWTRELSFLHEVLLGPRCPRYYFLLKKWRFRSHAFGDLGQIVHCTQWLRLLHLLNVVSGHLLGILRNSIRQNDGTEAANAVFPVFFVGIALFNVENAGTFRSNNWCIVDNF